MPRHSQPIRTNTSNRARVSGSPVQAIVDACDTFARRFSDPVAMEGINLIATAADAIEALGKAFNSVGRTTASEVYIDPRVLAYCEELGKYVLAAVQPTRDGAAAVQRAHRDDIDRVVENDPRKRRWDIAAHDGRMGSGSGSPRRPTGPHGAYRR
jgi:hypothetical protein